MLRRNSRARIELKRRLAEVLEEQVGDQPGRIVGRLIVLLILVNLVAVTLESVPRLSARYGMLFSAIEITSLLAFSVEYLVRIWVAGEHPSQRHQPTAKARWRYVCSPAGIIDLLAVLPFWFAFVLPTDLRVLLMFRIMRFLKLARYSPGMRSLLDALYAERRALIGCFVILLGAALISATAMHLVEQHAQPEKFGTIPDAMWWAIVTLGTIGYGDVVPITTLGRLVAGVTIFGGLIMIALPVGIIATAFAEEIHRRDFMVTWGMVARVPLFAELNAGEIADIMRLMRAQTVEPGDVVVRRGDVAHSMYFVAAGEVEIELKDGRIRLGIGHFFGEIAVLRQSRRSATVTAVSRTSLLVLDAQDLHALMEREPRVAERIHDMMRQRLGEQQITPKGDLISEELEAEAKLDRPRRK
ncbi:MAG TPA: cyclic nucleotide-gated ion channel [Xanthobacteraceae bacterium]